MRVDPTVLRLTVATTAMAVCLVTAATATHHEPAIDWAAVADEETVYVLTTDEDGDARDTKIWLLVLDGVGYVRTSQGTTWGANAERNPEIGIRIGESDYDFRAAFVTEPAERARIVEGFEAKYGSNPILNWIRGDDPRIIRLDPR
jgi:hypothetical protein